MKKEDWDHGILPSMPIHGESSGLDVDYYVVDIDIPKRFKPYKAECEDIIEALGMTFAEGSAFKSIWRSCAERTLGKKKAGNTSIRDAEKVVYYGQRMLEQRRKSLYRGNENDEPVPKKKSDK